MRKSLARMSDYLRNWLRARFFCNVARSAN
jgi:hypothetical protein